MDSSVTLGNYFLHLLKGSKKVINEILLIYFMENLCCKCIVTSIICYVAFLW